MPLQNFPLLQDNTRLIRFKDTLYKVKVKYQINTFPPGDVNFSQSEAHDEIEQTFRAVLYLSERNQTLKTIATPNFYIKPIKTPWSFPRKCSDCAFQQNGKSLKVFDHMFEFHIANRDSIENIAQNKPHVKKGHSVGKILAVNSKQNENLKTGCREAVVLVTDITSDGTTRFGRTEAGQLYRVCTHDANTDHASSEYYKGKVKYEDEENRKSGSPKKGPSNKRESQEGDDQVEEKDVEKTSHEIILRRSKGMEIPALTANEHDKSMSSVKIQNNKIDREISKTKSKIVRDKFSLRASELSELKRENVQHQRLRSRKYASEKSLTHALRKPEKEINYEDRGTESESSQTEVEDTKGENEHRIETVDNRQREIKHLQMIKNRSRQITNQKRRYSTNNRKGQPKSKVVRGHRLKTGRSLKRRFRHRSSKVLVESSSQSETEIETTSDNNTRKRMNSIVSSDFTVKEDKAYRRIRTRLLQRLRSLRKKQRTDSSTESVPNESAKQDDRRHSLRLALRSRDSATTEDNRTDKIPDKEKATNKKRKSETLETNEIGKKSRKLRRSGQEMKDKSAPDKSSLTSSDSESGPGGPGKKRKVDTVETRSEDGTNSVTDSQVSGRSRKVKLYANRHSPQVLGDFAAKPTREISSPLVSTVLPLKRNQTSDVQHGQRSLPTVTSPRITRQTLHEDESRRIQTLREERPSQIYRNIMLAQGRDRHLVEQAENAETDKLRQLYEPTVPRRSPRLTGMQEAKKRRSSGLWGKIMETLVTPTKKYMFGNRK